MLLTERLSVMPRTVVVEPFRFEDKEYEVRVTYDDSARVYEARAYLNGKPASPYAFSVHADIDYDFRQLHEGTLVKGIVDEARRVVVERVWEGFLKACRDLKAKGL